MTNAVSIEPRSGAQPSALPVRDTLTRRASLGAVASVLDFASSAGVSAVITPVLLRGLGTVFYGIWEILNRLVSQTVATDGRPTEALRLVVANHQQSADAGLLRRYVGGAAVVWLLFLPLVMALGAVLTWVAPSLVKATPEVVAPVRLACGFLVVGMMLMTLGAIPQSVLEGMNLGYRRMGLQASVNVAGGILMAGAVLVGLGLPALAAARAVTFGIGAILFLLLARRYVDWFGAARPTRADVSRIFGVSLWVMVGDTITRLLGSSDVVILGFVRSPALVTTYVLTGYASKFLAGLLTMTVGAAMPGFGGLIGSGALDRAAASRRELLAGTWLALTAAGGTILVWNRSLLSLWVGPGRSADPLVTLLIVLITAQTVAIRTYVFMIDAALQTRFRVRTGAVSAVCTVTCMLAGAYWSGLPGLCVGLLVGRAYQTVANPLYVYRHLFRHVREASSHLMRVGRASLITALTYAGAMWLGTRVETSHWVTCGIGCMATLLTISAVAFILGLDSGLRTAIWQRGLAVVRPHAA